MPFCLALSLNGTVVAVGGLQLSPDRPRCQQAVAQRGQGMKPESERARRSSLHEAYGVAGPGLAGNAPRICLGRSDPDAIIRAKPLEVK